MIDILFQDGDVLAANKPEGLSVVAERDPKRPCLLDLVRAELGLKPFAVHRIDKPVSGVVLLAKNARAHRHFCMQFENHTVRKRYLALVHGRLSRPAGQIDAPLRAFGSGRVAVDERRGKPSLTEYRLVKIFGEFSLLECSPRTGRRHQLRAHLYALGHPVVGDLLYGDGALQKRFPRLMLHARSIEFELLCGERLTVEAPLPASFGGFLVQIERAKDVLSGISPER